MTDLSIIIVNYRSTQLLMDCLQSVFQSSSAANTELIVVDSFSQDGGEKIIKEKFPQIRWIQLDYNAGFARANNAGIRSASGEIVLLLNPDTLIEGNAIEECFRRLLRSDYVATGVQLLNADRSPQITGNYFMKGGLNHLMSLPYMGRLIRWMGYALKVKKTNVAKAEGAVEVDWINGAFLMVKRSAIAKAGILDEDFFLYSEEIEWCSRLRKQGKLCVYGDLNVIHLQGESANDAFGSGDKGYRNLSDKKGLQIMLSGFVRIRKQFGVGWFLFHLAAHLFTIPVYFIITLLRTIIILQGGKAEWNSFFGFSKNVFRVCGDFFSILRNRPHFYKVL
jgi:GT2 family glycosyltransferase